jgi:2-furoate---CoA ligase
MVNAQVPTTLGLTIGEAFERAVSRAGSDLALVDGRCRRTYEELDTRANRLANAFLEQGFERGDRVMCCMRNRAELVEIYLALQKIGGVYAPVNFRLSSAELGHCVRLIEPRAIVFEELSLPLAETLRDENPMAFFSVDTAPSLPKWVAPLDQLTSVAARARAVTKVVDTDLSLILLTSGTTGRPKGVPRTHANEIAATLFNLVAFPWRMGERILSVMPLYHTMGVRLLLSGVLLGGTNVLQRRWDPAEAMALIEHEEISTMFLVPTMYHDLLRTAGFDARRLTTLRSLGSAGMVIREDLYAEIRAAFGPMPFVNIYGCSELYCLSFADYLERKPGTVGRGAPHQELRVVPTGAPPGSHTVTEVEPGELGEIVARASAPDAFAGYWRAEEATARVLKDGWYFTRDLGYRDEDGDLYIVGRADDMIISGGENVHPLEVESVLALCPGVADVCVAGLPDDRWGQAVTAFIVRGDASLTEQAVAGYCLGATALAAFKRPRRIYFVDEIPKSSVGKVQRQVLQERFSLEAGVAQP